MSIENLTVIIPFRNGHATIQRLLDSLPDALPVIVVDDVSDESYKPDSYKNYEPYKSESPNLDRNFHRHMTGIICNKREYFSGAVNEGIANCDTDVLVLNQDVWFESDAWLGMLETARHDFGIIGDGVMNHPAWTQGYVQGTFMFLSRGALRQVGMLNADDYPLWGATCEWQLRACRAGFKALPFENLKALGFRHGRTGNYGASIAETLREEPEREKLLIRTPPAISVIITAYNYGRYLQDAVNSLLGGPSSLGMREPQTFQSFEIVIVDDASTDETREVGEALADVWKGIRFIRRNTRGGSAAAANTGIAAAFGKYVTVLDADDMMEPTRLEKLYRVAEANPHSVVYDDLRYFRNGQSGDVLPLSEYDFEIVLYKNLMHKGIFFERAAWKQVGGYPEKMNEGREDWAMNVALGVNGYCGVHVAEPLYLYRRENQNRSLTNGGPEWREFFLGQLRDLFPQIYAGVRPMGCCGNKSNAKNNVMQMRAAQAGMRAAIASGGQNMELHFIGAEGMTLLEYLIPSAGASTYYGPVTGATYLFGGRRVRGYVDNRDVDEMLKMREGRHQAFARATSDEGRMTNDEVLEESVIGEQLSVDSEQGTVEMGDDAPTTDDEELGDAVSDAPVVTKAKSPRKSTSRKKKQ